MGGQSLCRAPTDPADGLGSSLTSLLPVWPWTSSLASLCLCFPIWNMELKTELLTHGWGQSESRDSVRALRRCLQSFPGVDPGLRKGTTGGRGPFLLFTRLTASQAPCQHVVHSAALIPASSAGPCTMHREAPCPVRGHTVLQPRPPLPPPFPPPLLLQMVPAMEMLVLCCCLLPPALIKSCHS